MDIDAQTDGILPGAFHEGLLAAARALSSTKGNETLAVPSASGKKEIWPDAVWCVMVSWLR